MGTWTELVMLETSLGREWFIAILLSDLFPHGKTVLLGLDCHGLGKVFLQTILARSRIQIEGNSSQQISKQHCQALRGWYFWKQECQVMFLTLNYSSEWTI